MSTKIKVTWRGPVPGLSEHRISLDAFGPAIDCLLRAYRRIASNMLREAEDRQRPDKRLRNRAKWLDLQVESVIHGSAGPSLVAVTTPPPGMPYALFDDLAIRAGMELLESIDAEANGHPRSRSVRNYLQALPQQLGSQHYDFEANGSVLKSVSIGVSKLPEVTGAFPYLIEHVGMVVAVGFEPGAPFVRIAPIDGDKPVTCDASQEQVETALGLRASPVRTLAVHGNRHRLLRICRADEQQVSRSPDERKRLVFEKWGELLRRLGQ